MPPEPRRRSARDDPRSGGRRAHFRHLFLAEPHAVRDALRRAVARFARQITPEDTGALELTLAEVLNNVVEHGYAGLPAGPIDLRIVRGEGGLLCRIEDDGAPMPRLAVPDRPMPEMPDETGALPEGGWGWALIRDLADDLDYSRDNGRNRLSFRVPLLADGQASEARPRS